MINLNINGNNLDLYPVSLSYKRTNNAFTFGKLTLNRTQSFKIPKTPNNLRIFNDLFVQTEGQSERRYFDAQLQCSAFVENGQLYIDGVYEKDISCVFIFGSLIELKKIAETKNMAEVLEPYDMSVLDAPSIDAKLATQLIYMYDVVSYRNEYVQSYGRYWYIMPSTSVRDLLACANDLYGQTFDLDVIAKNYRIIQNKVNSATRNNVVFAKTSLNEASPNENLKSLFTFNQGAANVYSDSGVIGSWKGSGVIEYKTIADTDIQFPNDFPTDIFVLWNKSRYDKTSGKVNVEVEFFGGYSFDTGLRTVNSLADEGTRATTGEPLAGRTITIPTNKGFSFYRKDNFHNTQGAGGSANNNYRGFFDGDATPFEFTMPVVSIVHNQKYNVSLMCDNLPKMSFVDLYNSIAILQGKYVTYLDNKLTMIDYSDFNQRIYLKNVISLQNIKREGLTKGRHNLINFKKNNIVAPAYELYDDYTSNNETINETETIYTIPYSEGEEYTSNNDLYLNDVAALDGNKFVFRSDEFTIAEVVEDGDFLKRVSLQDIDLLRRIYQKSTRIEVNCEMSLFEYMIIKENNTIIYAHCEWVWISATWQKNRAKFVLQKI